jgi:hypothetical protein
MRRLLLVVGALAVAAYAAGTGTAVDKSGREGPPCANIVRSDIGYVSAGTGSKVGGIIELAAPPCDGSSYTLFVSDSSGTQIGSDNTPSPDPQDPTNPLKLYFEVTLASASPTVCVHAETTYRGRIADRGPDRGCQTLELDSQPGGEGFD